MNPLDCQKQVILLLGAQLQQRVALAVAQLLRAEQGGEPSAVAGDVLRRGRAGCCLANPWPSSSNRCAEAFGYSISGWSMGLMRIRWAMECRRRS